MLDTMNSPDISNALDARGLAALKRQVHDQSPQAIKAAAQQFEGLFLQMVLKSMRDATPHDGIMDSDQSRLYESLLDQQLAQVLSSKGGGTGLAAMIEKQLTRGTIDPQSLGELPLQTESRPMPLSGLSAPLAPAAAAAAAATAATATGAPAAGGMTPRDFVSRVWPHAYEASRATGIPAHFMVAQAALETGWGKSEPRLPSGRSSFNLFGIKAGKSWSGAVVEAATSEVVDGQPQRQIERFRAYSSYAEAFSDYAHLLASNPRYAAVLGQQDAGGFARALQQAGYATDPMYSAKLERIIGGNVLRSSLST